MPDRDPITADALDRLVAQPAGSGDWEAVLRDARPRRPRVAALLVPVAVVVALTAVALLWPFGGGDRPGILDRALAAVGDGPVLHVVFRGEWGGTDVDLQSGDRAPVYGESEVWYDRDRGLVHRVERLGGAIEAESVSHPLKPPTELAALAGEYRDALSTGTARVVEEGTVGGEPVYWIAYRTQMLPDVADGRDHEFSEQVAVSTRTFKPVALRSTRDGRQGPATLERVIQLETVDKGDFDAAPANDLNGVIGAERQEPTTLAAAAAALGVRPLWLGHSFQALQLGEVAKTTTATARRVEVELRGQEAADVRNCLGQAHGRAGRVGPACERMRAAGNGSVSIHDGRVYATRGKPEFGPPKTGLSLFYGTIADDPSTYREDPRPDPTKPYFWITESAHREAAFRFARPIGYVPPAGSVFLSAGGTGFLQRDGLYVTIQASNEERVLAAARALELMPE